MSGFDPREDEDLIKSLNILTGDLLPVRRVETTVVKGKKVITKGRYFIDEEDLPANLKPLLHGRAFVIDKEAIGTVSPDSPETFYVAASKTQGLLVPGRSMSISFEGSGGHYRWTDDGERWTGWITLPNGVTDSYSPLEKNRFAEVQAYSDIVNADLYLKVTR